jgi:hypothetical protein
MKRISITIRALSVLLLAPPQVVICQEIASLRAGEPIRVSMGSPVSQRIEGRLVSVSADTIVLRGPTNLLPIRFSTVSLLEVKRRSGGRFMNSVFFGLLAGAAGGALLGLASGGSETGEGFSAQGMSLIGAIYGGTAGLVGGTMYGACCAYSWKPVPLPQTRASDSTR